MTEQKAMLAEGKITEEGIKKLRDLTGTRLRIRNIFNQLASREAIRNYVNGIGDPNPLFRDEEYARSTAYGNIVAPPNWYYSIFPTWVQVGLPGVHGFHSGSDWKFYKPVFVMDHIRPECAICDVKEKESKFAKKTVIVYFRSQFFNQKDELLAEAVSWSIRAERGAARGEGKYASIEMPHPWKEDELQKVEDEVLAEEVRGGTPRYWEDVTVGDELKPVVKGPLGLTDMIAYCIGAAPVQLLAHHVALELYRRHPAWAFRDHTSFALEPAYGVHFNKAAANAAGLPYPYDVGTQRQGWLIHLLTNWMGDAGWLKTNYAEYRRFVYFSDVVRLTGKVTAKRVDEDGEHCVDVETHAVNQRDEDTMPGRATIVLPSRESGTNPVAQRLGK
ncbi:MAG: MaoC family dehydratase N-terminal domain-containing protein [Chloroflexota bacterium]